MGVSRVCNGFDCAWCMMHMGKKIWTDIPLLVMLASPGSGEDRALSSSSLWLGGHGAVMVV